MGLERKSKQGKMSGTGQTSVDKQMEQGSKTELSALSDIVE
jgi:hypothetical protein